MRLSRRTRQWMTIALSAKSRFSKPRNGVNNGAANSPPAPSGVEGGAHTVLGRTEPNQAAHESNGI